jgi:hypothetical protein
LKVDENFKLLFPLVVRRMLPANNEITEKSGNTVSKPCVLLNPGSIRSMQLHFRF